MLKHENFEPQPHSHWEVGPGVPGPQGTNTPHDITRGARAGTSARMRTRPLSLWACCGKPPHVFALAKPRLLPVSGPLSSSRSTPSDSGTSRAGGGGSFQVFLPLRMEA